MGEHHIIACINFTLHKYTTDYTPLSVKHLIPRLCMTLVEDHKICQILDCVNHPQVLYKRLRTIIVISVQI